MKILLYLKIVIHQKFITTVGPKKGDEKKGKKRGKYTIGYFLKIK